MASDQDNGEKTEEATDTKREEFRKKGQVVQSKELATTLFIVVSIGLIAALSKWFMSELNEVFQQTLGSSLVAAIRSGEIMPMFKFAATKAGLLMAPVLIFSTILAIGATVVQVGFLQVEDALTPKPERIDPVAGFGRLFSMRVLVEGLKAFLKFIFVGFAVYSVLKTEVWKMPWLIQFGPEQLMHYMGEVTVKVLVGIAISMAIIAAADYFFQRWDMDKQMMMTKQEVKEEHKSREGDPLIKARIRKIQREVANRRMMEKVPKADVIITNPTHIAVALKYDANLPAPQLIAKGADNIAEKMKEIARTHNIPIVENKPLARTIYKTLKLGQVIPRELFVAVAEVLSYVYKLRKKVRRS
jgi:flagellar biosynthetic protein FlhB